MVGAIGQWSAACRSLATKFEANPGSVGCCRGRGPYAFSGPDKRLSVKVTTCNIPVFRNPAVILIDQLRAIYIDGELDAIETANWLPKLVRKDYAVGLSIIGNGVDDPDQNFYERYACGAAGNFTGYCNPELDKMIAAQSAEKDQDKRKRLVWEIERNLAKDASRPIIYYSRTATHQPIESPAPRGRLFTSGRYSRPTCCAASMIA